MSLSIISILLLLLSVAAWQDFQRYHIANLLVFPGTALGLLLNTWLPSGLGFSESLIGWGVGLLLLLPLYLLRVMAAGDVKLLAMVGAFLGTQAVVTVLMYVFMTGGVLAIGFAWHRGTLKSVFFSTLGKLFPTVSERFHPGFSSNVRELNENSKIPYGVAIGAGTVIFLISNY